VYGDRMTTTQGAESPAPPTAYLTSAIPAFSMAWRSLLNDHRVSHGAVRLYLVLQGYTRPDRPVAYPGQKALCSILNVSEDTVQRWGTELVSTGWIKKVRRGRGRSNLYHLLIPAPLDHLPADDPDPVVDNPVGELGTGDVDTADLRLLDTANLRLPYEEELLEEEVTPLTPRKRGGRGRASVAPLGATERADDFATWWLAYPRKIARIGAEKAWREMLPRLPDIEVLTAAAVGTGLRVQREHPEASEWVRYVPHPATWLRRGDWYSEMTETAVAPPRHRPPCVVCGVPDPSGERCMGVAKGIIGEREACPWN